MPHLCQRLETDTIRFTHTHQGRKNGRKWLSPKTSPLSCWGTLLVRAPYMSRADLQIPEVEQEADKPSFSCSNSSTTQTPHTYVPQRLSLFAACGHGRAFFQSVHQSTAFQNNCGHLPSLTSEQVKLQTKTASRLGFSARLV